MTRRTVLDARNNHPAQDAMLPATFQCLYDIEDRAKLLVRLTVGGFAMARPGRSGGV